MLVDSESLVTASQVSEQTIVNSEEFFTCPTGQQAQRQEEEPDNEDTGYYFFFSIFCLQNITVGQKIKKSPDQINQFVQLAKKPISPWHFQNPRIIPSSKMDFFRTENFIKC